MLQIRDAMRGASVLLLTVVAACAEPTAPAREEMDTQLDPRLGRMTLSTPSGSFILDVPQRKLIDGLGREALLTVEQTAELATLYQDIAFLDTLGAQLEASPPPIPMCGANPCEPELRTTALGGASRARALFATPSFTRMHPAGNGSFHVRRGTGAGSPQLPSRPRKSPAADRSGLWEYVPPGVAAIFEGPWACIDIAAAIYDVRTSANAERISLGTILYDIFGGLGFTLVGGVLRAEIPSPLWFGSTISARGAQQASNSVALNILAAAYSANNCSSNNWAGRGEGSGGLGGGGYHYECHEEIWEISFDGGMTWSDIEVEVCEYVYQS